VFNHESSKLTIQVIEQYQVAITHFIQYRDEIALSIRCSFRGFKRTDIGNIAIVTNRIIVDVIADILYQAVIAHRHVSKRGIVDSRMLYETLANLNTLFEIAKVDVAIKHHSMKEVGLEILRNLHVRPIFRPTTVVFQYDNLFFC
jgi:hypothetical protein